MATCPQCGRYLSVHWDACPSCARDSSEAEADIADTVPAAADSGDALGPFVPIARFTNGAEAGFFAHELDASAEIPARLLFQENFDALDGVWANSYVLTVPESAAARAAELLQTMVHGTHADDQGAASERQPAASATDLEPGSPAWVPILLTLAAGSVAYWGIERLERPPAPRPLVHRVGQPPPPDQLWDVLASSPTPWTQPLRNGRGLRRLRVDRDRHAAIVEEDADGDGRFERTLRFRLQPPR
jgi:hypothetical protein